MHRPLFLHYQDDPESFTIEYQYLFGRDLLVAPVIAPEVDTWEVYLPPDTWEHLYNGQVHTGPGRVTVEAPLGQPPVFFRTASPWRESFLQVKDLGKQPLKVAAPEVVEEKEALEDSQGHCDADSGGCH